MAEMNKFEIEMFAKRAAQELIEHERPLNDSILEFASVGGWTREQVKRVTEAANTITNGELVKRAKAAKSDPCVTFKLADSTEIFGKMIGVSAEAKLAEAKQIKKLSSMFFVPVTKPAIEKTASTAEPRLSTMSGPELAAAYIRGEDVSKSAFTIGQISDACADIERVGAAAREKWASIDLAEESVLAHLASEIEAQMHAGMTPATLRAACAQAPVEDTYTKVAGLLIDAKMRDLDRDEGASVIKEGTIVDLEHPMAVDLCKLMLLDVDRDLTLGIAEKIADAGERADADFKRARQEGHAKLAFNLGTAQRAVSSAKNMGGNAMRVVGLGLGAAETASRARDATKRLKKMQATPIVGPMKMAAAQLGFDFMHGMSGLKPSFGTLGAIALASGIAAAGTAGAEKLINLAGRNVSSMFERRKREKLYEQLLQREPTLKQHHARAREVFDMVLTYAPSLADHPMAIGDFMKRQLQYPVSGVEFLAALAKLQLDVSKAREAGRGVSAFSSGVGEAVRGAQGQWIRNS